MWKLHSKRETPCTISCKIRNDTEFPATLFSSGHPGAMGWIDGEKTASFTQNCTHSTAGFQYDLENKIKWFSLWNDKNEVYTMILRPDIPYIWEEILSKFKPGSNADSLDVGYGEFKSDVSFDPQTALFSAKISFSPQPVP